MCAPLALPGTGDPRYHPATFVRSSLRVQSMMKRLIVPLLGALVITVVACEQAAPPPPPGPPPPTPVERGKYIVNAGGCHDCHTPAKMGPNGPEPDMSRMLSGHPENLKVEAPPKMSGGW